MRPPGAPPPRSRQKSPTSPGGAQTNRAAKYGPAKSRAAAATIPTGIPQPIARSAPLAAAWTGFGAAIVGAFVAVVVSLLFWIPDAAATGSSGSTARAGVLTFLAAQHGGVVISGVSMSFVPLGLTFLAGWLCWRAARVLAALPVVIAETDTAPIARLLAVHVAAYALTCSVLVRFATVGTSSVGVLGVFLGAVVVSFVFAGSSLVSGSAVGRRWYAALPAGVLAPLRAGIVAAATMVGFSALLVAGATVLHAGRAMQLIRGLGGGLAGLPVAVLDALAAPNAVAAGAAYLAGPGFAVGTHASFSPLHTAPGIVPGFPVLAGLPSGRHASPVVFALILVAFGCTGWVAARLLREQATRRWAEALRAALLTALVTATVLAVFVAAAGGSLGQHRLAAVGGSPIRVWAAVFVEILVVATAGVVATKVVALLHHDEPRDRPTVTAKAVPGGTIAPDPSAETDELPTVDEGSAAVEDADDQPESDAAKAS